MVNVHATARLASFSFLASVLVVTVPHAMFAQEDPELGTWKLDTTKSTFRPGPPLRSQIRTLEKSGDGQRLQSETITADGTDATVTYTANFDGEDYPVTGSPYGDSVSLRRINGYTVEATVRKTGKVTLTDRRVVSMNGDVVTINQTGTNPTGQSMHNVLVYDRQWLSSRPRG